ncbi:MAG: hypothetical protein LBO72_11070 [Helicobacteraceae bacterium]|jgi:hypothetical protein|nr:hypothetical protein [Helicobacteraceae bacterium]
MLPRNLIVSNNGSLYDGVVNGQYAENVSSGFMFFDICFGQWARKGRLVNGQTVSLANNFVRVPESKREYFCGGIARKSVTLYDNTANASPNASGSYRYFFVDENNQAVADASPLEKESGILALENGEMTNNLIYATRINWRAKASDKVITIADSGGGNWVYFNSLSGNVPLTVISGSLTDAPFMLQNADGTLRISIYGAREIDEKTVYPCYEDSDKHYEYNLTENANVYRCDYFNLYRIGGNYRDDDSTLWKHSSYLMKHPSFDDFLDKYSEVVSRHDSFADDYCYGIRDGYIDKINFGNTTQFYIEVVETKPLTTGVSYSGVIDDSVFKPYQYDGNNNLGIETLIGMDDLDADSYDNNWLDSKKIPSDYNLNVTYEPSGYIKEETTVAKPQERKVTITLEKGEYLLGAFSFAGAETGSGLWASGGINLDKTPALDPESSPPEDNSNINAEAATIGYVTNYRVVMLTQVSSWTYHAAVSDANDYYHPAYWTFNSISSRENQTLFAYRDDLTGAAQKTFMCRYMFQLFEIRIQDNPKKRSWWQSFLSFVLIVIAFVAIAYGAYQIAMYIQQAAVAAAAATAASAASAATAAASVSTFDLIMAVFAVASPALTGFGGSGGLLTPQAPPDTKADITALVDKTRIIYDYQAILNPYDRLLDVQRLVSFN